MSMTPNGLTPFACAFTGSGSRIFRDLSGTGTAGLHIATPTHAAACFPTPAGKAPGPEESSDCLSDGSARRP
jgi:hypothetical protein